MNASETLANLREVLEASHVWPAQYTFKFIVPAEAVSQAEVILGDAEITRRPSKNGRYVGLTARTIAASADAILSVYEKMVSIPGVIAL
jgi:uncharacterized protein